MMSYLQQAVPDTLSYMIAGYTVIFSVMILYLVSLVVRFHRLRRDLETLRHLEINSHP